MAHPYQNTPAHQSWPKAMGSVAPGHVDPVVGAPRIGREEQVATLGSCFAQHIARHLQRSGCSYLVTEAAPVDIPPERATARQYGLFTARYGNVYTVRQALQLLRRAFGRFTPQARAWQRADGRWADPSAAGGVHTGGSSVGGRADAAIGGRVGRFEPGGGPPAQPPRGG